MTNSRNISPRGLVALIAESLILVGVATIALTWIIPSQTQGRGLGLSPGFLPSLCAIAIGILLVADGLLRIRRAWRPKSYPAGWLAFCIAGGLATMSAVLLDVLGVGVCTALTLPIGMIALGERRWLLIIGITIAMTACVVLITR
jgi:hypothetical protein